MKVWSDPAAISPEQGSTENGQGTVATGVAGFDSPSLSSLHTPPAGSAGSEGLLLRS